MSTSLPAPAPAASAPAAPPKKEWFADLLTTQGMLYGILALITLIAPLLILVIEQVGRYLTGNPIFVLEFASISGGPQILDRNLIPNLALTSNIGAWSNAFTTISGWDKTTALTIVIAFLLALVQGFLAIKDNLQGMLGGKAPDIGATIALVMIPVIWLIGTPIIAGAVLIACLPLVARERTAKTQWWIGPLVAVILIVAILAIGNSYLTWGTTSILGYLRWIWHFLINLGTNYGFLLIEGLKLAYTLYLFASPTRDGSGYITIWMGNAFVAIFLGMVPFSAMRGAFSITTWNPVFWYVSYNLLLGSIVLLREVARPGKGHSGKAEDVKKANPLSLISTLVHLFLYIGMSMMVRSTLIERAHFTPPPLLSILLGFMLVAFISGFDEYLVRAMPGAQVDQAKYFEAIGDHANIGPFRFMVSDAETIVFSLFIAIIYSPNALNWITTQASHLIPVAQSVFYALGAM